MTLRRHDLLRVTPSVWDAMLPRHPGLGDLPLVGEWARRGWPVIARRRMTGESANDLAAALPLPPEHGKRRVSFSFPAGETVTPMAPVLLRDAAATAPASWQPVIAGLLGLGESRVFGALLWQHVTGLSYLTDRSDLDLLWSVSDQSAAERLVQGLRRLDAAGPVRLDGELEVPDGAAVNWREFGQGDDVLVKTMDGVAMRPMAELFAR